MRVEVKVPVAFWGTMFRGTFALNIVEVILEMALLLLEVTTRLAFVVTVVRVRLVGPALGSARTMPSRIRGLSSCSTRVRLPLGPFRFVMGPKTRRLTSVPLRSARTVLVAV